MASNNADINRLMAVKSALVVMTNTQGWQYAKQVAANVVESNLQKGMALLDEDPVKADILIRKAKAMQDGFRDYFNAIETTKQYNEQPQPDWFEGLNFDSQADEIQA